MERSYILKVIKRQNSYGLELYDQTASRRVERIWGNPMMSVNEKSIFLEKHLKEALRRLEESGRIHPHDVKSDGKKRRRGTFPDNTVLDFSRRIL